MRAEAGDKSIAKMSDNKSKYLSMGTQNELILRLSEQVMSNLVSCIGESPFTVIADETTDVATKSQLCVAVRYLDKEDNINERFISFVEIASMTGTVFIRSIWF